MIKGIDHYNLRSDENMIEALKDFYINIVGLKLGQRPPFKSKGYWLYANDKDVLHLSSSKDNIKNLINVNSTLDHVSFSASNKNTVQTNQDCLLAGQALFQLPGLQQMKSR